MASNYYDTTIKRYPDGTVQYRASVIFVHSKSYLDSPAAAKESESDPVHIAKVSYHRTVDNLYDILHSNIWQYFFTLTLSPEKVDRYDYTSCCIAIKRFTHVIGQYNVGYVIVPERHKDGAWHFHGLMFGMPDRFLIINDNQYLEFKQYTDGFCSLSSIVDSAKASNYILKYIIKGYNYLDIPKGKKRYWASRNLARPDIEYDVLTQDQIDELLADSLYNKDIDSDFFKGYIINTREY